MRKVMPESDRARPLTPAIQAQDDPQTAAPPESAPLMDEYLLEVYRQACENARMYATSRFSNLSAFLAYVSLLTAGFAFLVASVGDSTGPIVPVACISIGLMGLTISYLFFGLEIRHHHWWKFYEEKGVKRFESIMGYSQYPDQKTSFDRRDFVAPSPLRIGATHATYGIYIASIIYFGTVSVAAVALLATRL
jgi:hypothetical protein